MMRQFMLAGAVLAAAALIGAGCEDQSAVPQAVLDQAKKASERKAPRIPTTQELVSGKRTRTTLLPLPLTLEVPPGWGKLSDNNPAGIKVSEVGLNILQGYAPSGEVQIQLSARPLIKEDELTRIMDAGKKEMSAKPQQIVKFELRPLGIVKLLERQSVGQARPLTLYAPDGTETTSMESSFNWSISVLVPNEGAYQDFTLSFIGLTKSQYDRDAEFLKDIMNTLRYAGDSASPIASPGATTLPTTLP